MSVVQEKKERIIAVINNLPEDKLKIIEDVLETISKDPVLPVEDIYSKAVEKYHDTLQKLAQ